MKIGVRLGKELRYVEAAEIKFGDKTLTEIFGEVEKLQKTVEQLIGIIQQHFLIKEQGEYIIQIGDKLHKVEKLEIANFPKNSVSLALCKVENGKLVIDNKKVGGSI